MSEQHLVNQQDIQGNILCGYGNSYRFALYLFVRFGDDERAARRWLRELIPEITTAEPWRPASNRPAETLNVAFTHRGLKRLGVPKNVRGTFPEDFRKGMKKRAGTIGDRGASAPRFWERALSRSHAVLTIMAQNDVRQDSEALHRGRAARHGAEVTYAQHAGLLEGPPGADYAREHFGFADGFSQPAIRGNAGPDTREGMGTPTADGGWDEIAPGEFVLGYLGEDGLMPYAPAPPLGDGGSYMVLRKLRQDVPAFRRYVRAVAESGLSLTDGYADPALRERVVAAKMVGRWPDGRSLVTSDIPAVAPDDPSLEPTRINKFRYERKDLEGMCCPIGAHVRRANPRDSLGWDGLLTKRHRIIRRGVPYGEWLPEGQTDDQDRGLMFVCYQTGIDRQFELIQSRWLNDGDALWLGDEGDCMFAGSGMTVPGRDGPAYLPPPDAPFVTTRGGDYFFAPGLAAMRALANAYWR